jgi:hypothetical protein
MCRPFQIEVYIFPLLLLVTFFHTFNCFKSSLTALNNCLKLFLVAFTKLSEYDYAVPCRNTLLLVSSCSSQLTQLYSRIQMKTGMRERKASTTQKCVKLCVKSRSCRTVYGYVFRPTTWLRKVRGTPFRNVNKKSCFHASPCWYLPQNRSTQCSYKIQTFPKNKHSRPAIRRTKTARGCP